jgi:hypothetical protein
VGHLSPCANFANTQIPNSELSPYLHGMKHFPHALAVMMLFLLGCGWDDDSQFEVRTRAVFFFCPDTSGNGMQVVRLDENGYAPPIGMKLLTSRTMT